MKVQYTVTPIMVPSLKVTNTLLKVARLYVSLQLLKELLGSWGGTVMVTTKLPEPPLEPGTSPRGAPPKGGVFGSPATFQVKPLAAATWNVVVSVPPVQLPALPSVIAVGVTASTTGAETVSVALPETVPDLAAMVVKPALTPDTSPALLTVATDVLLDDQVAEVVRS
jgi:hypothetical protein